MVASCPVRARKQSALILGLRDRGGLDCGVEGIVQGNQRVDPAGRKDPANGEMAANHSLGQPSVAACSSARNTTSSGRSGAEISSNPRRHPPLAHALPAIPAWSEETLFYGL